MTGNEMKQIILSVKKGKGMKIVLKNEKEVKLFRQKIFIAGKYGIKVSLVKVYGDTFYLEKIEDGNTERYVKCAFSGRGNFKINGK